MSESSAALACEGTLERPVTVLLVDDQRIVAESVRRMLLEHVDIRFHYCLDPNEAMSAAMEIEPTVILQDLVMPGTDGITLVKAFRAEPATRDIPLIVLSTREEPAVKAEAFACGANDYLVKLPSAVELVARVRYHSQGYVRMLQRNAAFKALLESRKQLEIRNRYIREVFGRHNSDDIVERVLETDQSQSLSGELRTVTVMMADVRGFSAIADDLPPGKVVALLNNYLEVMTEVILRRKGTISEILGDGILVLFGAPVLREDDAGRAVACALDMQLAVADVNGKNAADGLPPIQIGVGLNTGEVIAGSIGSSRREKYSVVGRHVNLVGRIENCTLAGQVLASAATVEAVGQDRLELVGSVEIEPKGFRGAVTIYDVTGMRGEDAVSLPPREEPLRPLDVPIAVACSLIKRKHTTGRPFTGTIVTVAADRAELEVEFPLPTLCDLRVVLLDENGAPDLEPFYAKVTSEYDEGSRRATISFTLVPPVVAERLRVRGK